MTPPTVRKEGTAGSSSGVPRPSARRRTRKSKTARKAEVRNALARNEPVSAAPAEADQLWANRINDADRAMLSTQADMVNAIISLGKTLLLAKDELGHGNFKAMVEHKTRFKLRTAELYMQIASNAYLANAQHVATLPPYVGTLGVLSSWKPTALEAAAKNGHLTPDLDRAKAKELSEQYGPPKAITARPAATTPAPDPDPEPEPEPVDDEGFAVMPDGSGQVRMKNKSGRALIGTRMPSGRVVVGGKLPERFIRPVARTVKELADLLAQEKPDDGVLLYIDHLAIIGDSSGTGITIPLGYDPEDET